MGQAHERVAGVLRALRVLLSPKRKIYHADVKTTCCHKARRENILQRAFRGHSRRQKNIPRRHAAETFRETLRRENHIRAKRHSLHLFGGYRRQDGAITRKRPYRNIEREQKENRQRTNREPTENQQRTVGRLRIQNGFLRFLFHGKRRMYKYFFFPRRERP